MKHAAIAALLFFLVACSGSSSSSSSSSGTGATDTSGTSPAPTTSSSAATPPAATTTKGDGSVGSACTGDADCAKTLTCLTTIPPIPQAGFPGMTFPGGYCTKKCGQPTEQNPELSPDCGTGASCEQQSQSTGQGGRIDIQICVKACKGNDECRAGYACKADPFGFRSCQPS